MAVINNEKQTVNKISVEIVSKIAAKAALSVPGVNRLNETIADNLTKKISGKEYAKGIKLSKNEEGICIDVYVNVDYGAKIPDLAWDIQSSVKEAVEAVTGLSVTHVNIHIQGVTIPKNRSQEG